MYPQRHPWTNQQAGPRGTPPSAGGSPSAGPYYSPGGVNRPFYPGGSPTPMPPPGQQSPFPRAGPPQVSPGYQQRPANPQMQPRGQRFPTPNQPSPRYPNSRSPQGLPTQSPGSRFPSQQSPSQRYGTSPSSQSPQQRVGFPSHSPGQRFGTPHQSSQQRFAAPTQSPTQRHPSPSTQFSGQRFPTTTQSPHQRFVSPNQSPGQRFATPSQSPGQRFATPSQSPGQRFTTPSQSPGQQASSPYLASQFSPSQGLHPDSKSPGQIPQRSPSGSFPQGTTSLPIRTPPSGSGNPHQSLSQLSGFHQARQTPHNASPQQPSLSQLSGFHQAKRSGGENRSLPIKHTGISPLPRDVSTLPPTKSIKTETFSSPSSRGVVKSEVLSYDDIKREALGTSSDLKPFSPTKMPYMETGCGSTLYKNVTAFSATKEERNPALTAKIDEDFSSCRTPLEVMKDVMTDNDWCENVTEEQKQNVLAKATKLKEMSPSCTCMEPGGPENGPFYVHLGNAQSLEKLRTIFEGQLNTGGEALRMEVVRYTGKEGKTSEDCPIAKWIIRRSGPHEKYLVVVKQRYRHFCEYSWVAVSIIQWEGLSEELADKAYDQLAFRTAKFGTETDRQCAANKKKTCACQGVDMSFNGASYTFGCSWTMYHNICKFCRSTEVHKFKLTDYSAEGDLQKICEELTDQVTPIYSRLAPDSCNNMCLFEDVASDCRIGSGTGRPFSGITCVCDFCAHGHRDTNNMVGGATAVVTLLRPEDRLADEKEDEQFHVLPLYVPDCTQRDIDAKVASGGLVVLNKFSRTIAVKATKKANCKRGRMPAERKRMMDGYIPKDYVREDTRTFNHPSLRPPGLPGSMPQLDGAYGLNVSGSSEGSEEDFATANFSLNSSTGMASGNDSHLTSDQSFDTEVALDGVMESMKIVTHESDCLEAFDDPNIGGVAFALTHGSVLIECAKQELHATTALKQPNRAHPHRIGLVFYQHKNLHHPNHGMEEFQRKRAIREFRDYVQWLKGNYVPTEAKLKAMMESGFVFPNEVKTVNKPMDVANPDDYFKSESFPGFVAAKEINQKLEAIDHESEQQLETFYVKFLSEGPPVEDEINHTPKFDEKMTEADMEEVKYYEEMLRKEFGPK
eukprot:GFUD01036572.1.p1 GENE.GFUD01036572.1~~GFUD01036572.1.p1  ORF type:complete len:1125 (+),score=251.74 GFUD01036572.1:63-3437(+)